MPNTSNTTQPENGSGAPPQKDINPKTTLTADEKAKLLRNIYAINIFAGSVGTLAGIGFAYKKGSKFWGYVGYILLGGIVFGTIGAIATIPMTTKLAADESKI